MNFKITLNKKQMQILTKALDCYSRIEIGQFDTAIQDSTLFMKHVCKYFSHDDFDSAIGNVKQLFGLPRHGSYGIYSNIVHQDAREAYAMQQVIRHSLWKVNPDRNEHTVDSSVCLIANEEPEIVVENG